MKIIICGHSNWVPCLCLSGEKITVRKFLWIESRGEPHLGTSCLLHMSHFSGICILPHLSPCSLPCPMHLRSLLQAPAILNYLLFSYDFVIPHLNDFLPSSLVPLPDMALWPFTPPFFYISIHFTTQLKCHSLWKAFFHTINALPLCLFGIYLDLHYRQPKWYISFCNSSKQ